ncbi:MAG: hypothetical protein ISS26_06505 [Candidatus Omnitrophica bacterium]|nr:hypothetical protein [Candidatus Omnitrophota bacterium]
MRTKLLAFTIVSLILILTPAVVSAGQPGDHENRDWNAGEFDDDSDPGGGMKGCSGNI